MGTKQHSNYESLITFTRASAGHALRPVSYGAELVTNGGDFSSGWSGTGWTFSSGQASVTGNGTNQNLYGTPVSNAVVGKLYQLSYEVVSSSLVGGAFRAGAYSGASFFGSSFFALSTSVGTHTLSFVGNPSGAGSVIDFYITSGATSGTLVIDNVSIKEVTFDQPDGTLTLFEHPNNVPRVEYDAEGNRLGLLVEEARTNLIAYSEDFSNAYWSKLSAVIDSTTVTNPDGTTDGFLFRPTSTAPRILRQVSSTTADHAHSVYAKAGGKDLVQVGQYNGSTYEMVLVNLNSGDIVASTGTASVTEMPDGWYRISLAGDSTSTQRYINISCGNVGDSYSATSISTTPDGVSGIYVYGAQLEEGSFPTSYIKTTGATATRSADVASIPVADFGYNQSEMTVFVEAAINGIDATYPRYLQFNGTPNNLSLYHHPSLDRVDYDKGTVGSLAHSTTGSLGSFDKIAASADSSGGAIDTSAGSLGTTSTTVDLSISSSIYIGSSGSNNFLNGHIKSIKYYPRRLTNAQLVDLTS